MTRRKYSSEEERREAQREMRRKRTAVIRELLEEHRMQMKARETEQRAEQRVAQNRTVRRGPYTLEEMVRGSEKYRKEVIDLLVKHHYDEAKAALDAWRLLHEA